MGTEAPPSDSTVTAMSPKAHDRQATPSTKGTTEAADSVVRQPRSKYRSRQRVPTASSNRSTPHPSTGVTYEPVGRTSSEMKKAATSAVNSKNTPRTLGGIALPIAETRCGLLQAGASPPGREIAVSLSTRPTMNAANLRHAHFSPTKAQFS